MEFKPKTASSRTRETARKMEAYPAALKTLLELALSSVDLARNIADLMDGETIEEKDQLSTIFNVVLGSALNGDPKSNLYGKGNDSFGFACRSGNLRWKKS